MGKVGQFDRKVVAMQMERVAVHDRSLQRDLDAAQMADWVNWLADWQIISHLTFRWEASLESGRRCYEKFMRRHLGRCSYFYALEENPSRDGFHVHSLWADAGSVFRREAWCSWFTKYGRARIEPVRGHADVSAYCSKYVCKERAWWNVKLQWHRIHGRDLRLESVGSVGRPDPLPVGRQSHSQVEDSPSVCGLVSRVWVKSGSLPKGPVPGAATF